MRERTLTYDETKAAEAALTVVSLRESTLLLVLAYT